ncbi:MAG: NepR family anti-sigma factor [Methylorubrum rhodinum]|uniref:NepR family anti-sigma factor n=1 Tax=Methylorubrum rhodinum TaxID=29428 RepID=UPI003BB03C20
MTEDEPAGALPGDRPCAARGGLSDQTQQRIGHQLRALYDSVLEQPVPDRFRDLIARLDDGSPSPDDIGSV